MNTCKKQPHQDSPAREEGSDPNNTVAPLDHATYLAHRLALSDAEGDAQQNLDKSLLTLSAGAFGLSIAFVSQVEPATALRLMYISWITFGLSILFEMFSFVTSQRAHRRDVVILDEDYENFTDSNRRSRWNVFTILLNILAGLGFLVGAVFLVVFVARNVI